MTRWRAPGGIDIERIVLDGRECLRMRHHGFLVGYSYTINEVEDRLEEYGLRWTDLEPVDPECE